MQILFGRPAVGHLPGAEDSQMLAADIRIKVDQTDGMIEVVVGENQIDRIIPVKNLPAVPEIGDACSGVEKKELILFLDHHAACLIAARNPAGGSKNMDLRAVTFFSTSHA